MLRVGNGNPLTVISSLAGDMFPAPVCGKSLLRTNARRGALNAPQLLPPIPTFPAPVHRKSRAAFLAAPRLAPVDSFPPERFRPLLRLGKGNPLTVISSLARDMFPAPVCGKPRAGRTPVAAHQTRRNSCLRFRRFQLRSNGKAARPFWPRPAGLRWNRSRRTASANCSGEGTETR